MTDTSTIDPQHPWPWLDPFTEAASNYFGGREDEAQALLRSVLMTPVCVLFGKSGLGKTSLLLAGLFPALREQYLLPVPLRRFAQTEGSTGLSAQLLRLIDAAAAQWALRWTLPTTFDAAAEATAVLWQRLHERRQQLVDDKGRRWTPVFVLDQFEEVFTLQLDERRRRQTFEELGDLLENRVPPAVAERLDAEEALLDHIDVDSQSYRFLISLREDFLPELEYWVGLIPRLGPNRYRLLPMAQKQASQSVLKTGGALVDTETTQQIVQFLGRQPAQSAGREERRIEPALLSLVCASLNADRLALTPPGARLNVTNLEGRGAQILDRFYDDAFIGLAESDRVAAAQFVQANLITRTGARRPYPLPDVDATLLPALRHLVNRRLMRIEVTEQGDQIELVHDRLAAVASQRAQATQRQAEAAERLRREKEAAELEVLKQRAHSTEIAQESARLEQARAEDAVRAARRARWLTAAMSVFGMFAFAAAILAWNQRESAMAARGAAEAARKAAETALGAAREANEQLNTLVNTTTGADKLRAVQATSEVAQSYELAIMAVDQLRSEAVPEGPATWGVVFGGDSTLDAARSEVDVAARKHGIPNAAIYLRSGSYRSVAVGSADRSAAQAILGRARQRRADAYIVNMNSWCPHPAARDGYTECVSP